MSKPIQIAQITDLHIKKPGELAYGRIDTAAAMERLIGTLNALQPRPDLVIATGDLVDCGSHEAYMHLRGLLTPLSLPLLVCPGNHDDREQMRRMFKDQAFATQMACNTRHDLGPLTVLLLDSSTPGQPQGTLDAQTLAWLDHELAMAANRPVMIFLHHPPFATGIWHMDRQNLSNASDLERLVMRHRDVRLIAAGHVHRATFTRFAGTLASIAPAPNHAVALDLGRTMTPSFQVEPPAFHLHVWFPDRVELVTHVVPVGTFDGPHPFFGGDGKLL
jgi:3',5'-cyclic-AMP phosphodiesterase